MNSQRLYFLDWVRVLAFFLLIFYHTGMYYVSWDWHVKSVDASHAIEPLMMLSSPWRLGLLFLVSGAASRYLLDKLKPARFLAQRSVRLLVPLVFGMAVIVPPQPYLEVVEKLAYSGSYLDFLKLYFQAYHGFCRGTDCLDLPTWNHLWFLPYLWVYAIALGMIGTAALSAWSTRLGRLLSGWRLLVLPIVVLAVLRVTMLSHFPTTHDLVHDWYMHATYFTLFLLGALMAPQVKLWDDAAERRWSSLAIALTCWALLVIYFALPDDPYAAYLSVLRPLQRCVYAACIWSAILAACGFARRHLNVDSPARRYLTEAVFPLYIAHQTLIVVIAHALKPAHLAPAIEAPIIIVLTMSGSFALFEAVRRVRVLRPLFGLAAPAAAKAVPAPAMQAA